MKKFLKVSYIFVFTITLLFSKAFAAPTFIDSFSVDSEEDEPRGITFNNNGTKMFIIGWRGDDVNEFNGPLFFIPKSHKYASAPSKLETVTTSYPLWTVDQQTVK